MGKQNHNGQCALELALVTLSLMATLMMLKHAWRAQTRGFARAQLSSGRR